MRKKIKFLFSVLLISMVIFSGCAPKMTVQSLLINGEYIPVETLLKIDSYEVSLFEYRFYYRYIKLTTDNGRDSYWDTHKDDIPGIKDSVLSELRTFYAVFALADQLGIKLTKESKNYIDVYIEGIRASCANEEEFRYYFEEIGSDEVLYRKRTEKEELEILLYDYYFGDNGIKKYSFEEIVSFAKENFSRYKQIFVRYDFDETTTNKDIINSIVKQISEADDKQATFEKLMEQYSRDPDLSNYPEGYYMNKDGNSKFKDVLAALDENEVSEIVEGENGYYVFMRLPMGDDVVKNISNFRSEMENDFYAKLLDEIIAKQNIQIVSEYYDKISFETLLYE